MNPVAIILLSLVFVLMGFIAFGLVFAMNANYATGKQFREILEQRVRRLRFSKMLGKRGLDAKQYVSHLSVHELENEIRNCEGCKQVKICDETLKSPFKAEEKQEIDYPFCPNNHRIAYWGNRP